MFAQSYYVLNSLTFYCLKSLFPSSMNEILATVILVVHFLPFSVFKYIRFISSGLQFHQRSAVARVGKPLVCYLLLLLAAFNMPSCVIAFVSWISVLHKLLSSSSTSDSFCGLLDLIGYLLFHAGDINHILFSKFLISSSPSSRTPHS